MLQTTGPERLTNKDGSKGDTWIPLGRGNRMDYVGRLGAGGHRNRRDQVGEGGMEKECGERQLEWEDSWG